MIRYHLDLSQYGLEWLQHKLETEEIVPKRRILQERISERFAVLRNVGVRTVGDLVVALKTREKIVRLSGESELPIEYLVWLGREARSYLPNPFALRDIPGVDSALATRLEAAGIKSTKGMFDRAAVRTDRGKLSQETGAPDDELLRLVKLSDLARVRGIGRTFVRLFYEAGADSVDVLSAWNPEELFDRLHDVNRTRRLSAVVPSLKDVASYVDMATELPKCLEL